MSLYTDRRNISPMSNRFLFQMHLEKHSVNQDDLAHEVLIAHNSYLAWS
jgi:DNA-binding XRE family transcriptional regulator